MVCDRLEELSVTRLDGDEGAVCQLDARGSRGHGSRSLVARVRLPEDEGSPLERT